MTDGPPGIRWVFTRHGDNLDNLFCRKGGGRPRAWVSVKASTITVVSALSLPPSASICSSSGQGRTNAYTTHVPSRD